MLRVDLAVAGIPYRDHVGRVFDFHSLRLQLGVTSHRSGIGLAAAQQLLGHSTPTLTANVYSALGGELAVEVEKLPKLAALGTPLGT